MKKSLLGSMLILLSCSAWSSEAWLWKVSVQETIVDSTAAGQCQVRLPTSVDVPGVLSACKPTYITMDCGAELPGSSKSNSKAKFELAQIAQLTRQKISFLITDDQTIDGYCTALQVRLLGYPTSS